MAGSDFRPLAKCMSHVGRVSTGGQPISRRPVGSGHREPANAAARVERAPDADASPAAPAAAVPIGLGAAEVRRVAGTISDTAKNLAAPDRARTAAPSGAPVRVVTLTLNPEHLGRVALTIRLAGDRLSVRMDAEKEETARMIESDSEALTKLLGADG